MADKRRVVQPLRYSPYSDRSRKPDDPQEIPITVRGARIQNHSATLEELQQSHCIKNEMTVDNDLHDPNDTEVLVDDIGISPREVGATLRHCNFHTNIDIMEYLPSLTNNVHSLDVIDALTEPMHGQNMRDCLAGLCVMVNRLLSENRLLYREIQALRASFSAESVNRFDQLVFRKHNIKHEYMYAGDEYGIPEINLSAIADRFDLNAVRRNEGAINTLRRFVKFLLEQAIPPDLQCNFTLRERSGVEHLVDCPPELTNIVREMCLEAVNLGDVISAEDKEKREDMSDYIMRFIKYALQEMRRTPRKPKPKKSASVTEDSMAKEREECGDVEVTLTDE